MNQITILTVGGNSYAITDPGKLPQPETPVEGQLLTVEAVENGKVSRVGGISAESLGSVKTVNGIAPDARGNVQDRAIFNYYPEEGSIGGTVQDMFAAYQAGKQVILRYAEESPWAYFLPLVEVRYDLSADFFQTMAFSAVTEDRVLRMAIVHADGSCDSLVYDLATREDLGDVSEALDHILALQEELIG